VIKRFPDLNPLQTKELMDAAIAAFGSKITPVEQTWALAGLAYLGVPIDPTKRNRIVFSQVRPTNSHGVAAQFYKDSTATNGIKEYGIWGGRAGSSILATGTMNTSWLTILNETQLGSVSYPGVNGFIELLPSTVEFSFTYTNSSNAASGSAGSGALDPTYYPQCNILRVIADNSTFYGGTITLKTWDL